TRRLHARRSAGRADGDGAAGGDGLAGRRWHLAHAPGEPDAARPGPAPEHRARPVRAGPARAARHAGRARARLRRRHAAPDAPQRARPAAGGLVVARGRLVALVGCGRHRRARAAGSVADEPAVAGQGARLAARARRHVDLAGLLLSQQRLVELPVQWRRRAAAGRGRKRAEDARRAAHRRAPGGRPCRRKRIRPHARHPARPAFAMMTTPDRGVPRCAPRGGLARLGAARRRARAAQSGAALLMAMVIVTLIVSLAASMIWQQWRAVQVETAERARSQAAWILTGALDWARLILREDARNAGPDHLGEPWAVPLAEARLSTFLAADRENAEGAPDAFLSGSISDAQALYNLRNLVDGNGKIVPDELRALERLCTAVGVSLTTATNIANVMQSALAAAASPENEVAPLLPGSVMQFSWAGVSTDELRRLQPYVALLPRATPVNLNTASREVLVAAIDGLDLSS